MQILGDFTTSVEKAFNEIDPNWRDLDGLVVCGTHAPGLKMADEMILHLKDARENNIPTLAICFGMQMMIVEYLRVVLGYEDAHTTELHLGGQNVIGKLPELRVGMKPVTWKGRTTQESHWHNFAADNEYLELFKVDGWDISYTDHIAEIMQLPSHPHYLGTQFHPEYQSSKDKPHPLLVDFLNACRK